MIAWVLSPRRLALWAGLGSLGMLLGAFGFQYLMGLSPCPMCLWQRWPHALAAVLGLLGFAGFVPRLMAGLGVLSMGVSTGLGLYHMGVEQRWWEGPASCSAAPISGLSAEQLFDQIMAAPLVRCDEISWSLLGLSMPGWNALVSFGLMALWLLALWRAR